jgi:hypothetical protein
MVHRLFSHNYLSLKSNKPKRRFQEVKLISLLLVPNFMLKLMAGQKTSSNFSDIIG